MIVPCSSCGRENRVPAARLSAHARCGGCKSSLLPLARPVHVHQTAEFDEVIRHSPLPVVVDFWATWCPPCRAVAPEVERLASQLAGAAIVLEVDVDRVAEVAGRYGIRAVPSFVRFDGGRETGRTSGARSAAELTAALQLQPADRRTA